ncbi:siderophore-interacting protein [Stutzerimonas chloritidismutans]|uniref:siderophore-interacting protein n=1 Tax=Stutzerimonas chloritidismutans TaxID=203192 RepID=UPI003F184382
MTTSPSLQRRVQRVRHELRRREVRVSRVEPLDDAFMSITFHGEDLADFLSASFDDHIKFIFEDGDGNPVRRDYTPRRFEQAKRELTIEFALHGDGAASTWAKRAAIGLPALIGGPRGSMIIPMDYDWHLLIGDATALPAISRRLEELPAGCRVQALLLAHNAADRRALPTAADLDAQWFESGDELLAAVAALQLPAGEGFAWAAGEASLMKGIRRLLVNTHGQAKEAMRVAAYWRHGAEGFHEELTEQDDNAAQ